MSEQIKLSISGMSCGGCVSSVEKSLAAVTGVEQTEVKLDDSSATLTGSATAQALIAAIKEAGYGAADTS